MIDPDNVPPVADEELLARFIVNGNEIRADGSVRIANVAFIAPREDSRARTGRGMLTEHRAHGRLLA